MATNATKGKQRVTLEMLPSSLDKLGGFVERMDTSRGQLLDDLTGMFVGTTPATAQELHADCMEHIDKLSKELHETSNSLEQQTLEQRIGEYRKMANHFAVLATDGGREETALSLYETSTIALAGGKSELVPADMQIINRQDSSICKFVYMAWFMEPSDPKDQVDAWQGRTIGGLFGYLSPRSDLHLFGQGQSQMFRSKEEHDACAAEAAALFRFMLGCSKQLFEERQELQELQYAWALTTTVGKRNADIGIGYPIKRR